MAGQTAKRDLAIQGLLTCPTVAHAAGFARIGERTLRRWLKSDADFQGAYREARRRAFEQAVGKLATLSDEAVEELRRILRDKAARDRDRLRACHLVLSHARAASTGDVEELFEKLELALEKIAWLEKKTAGALAAPPAAANATVDTGDSAPDGKAAQ